MLILCVAVVCVIEKDNIYVIDEIQIWSSNTNEMVDEIKQDTQIKIL